MKTPQELEREIAEKDRMIELLKKQLTAALMTVAECHSKKVLDRKINEN